MHDTLTESGTAHPRASAYISGKAQMPVLSRHTVMCQQQGRSHDSLSGQVEFVPSLSDLAIDFRIGAIEIFS